MQEIHQAVGVVVLGMHRSGTSACTGLLHLHGAYLGETIAEEPDNPKGFWEKKDILQLNEDILRFLQYRWDWPWVLSGEGLEHLPDEFVRRRDAIAAELAPHSLWAVKDPRMCLLWSWWRLGLAQTPARLTILLCLRHPMQVAQSLVKRNEMELNQALMLWACHVLQAERHCRDLPRIVVFYEDIVNDPAQIISYIQDSFGIAFPASPSQDELGKFITSTLRHHRDSEYPNTAIGHLCQEIFTVFREENALEQAEKYDGFQGRLATLLQEDRSQRLPWALSEILRLSDVQIVLNATIDDLKTTYEQTDASLEKLEQGLLSRSFRRQSDGSGGNHQKGWWQRLTRGFSTEKQPDYLVLCRSPEINWLFDERWYCEQYPDAAQSGIPALRHYVLYGAEEEKRPNPYFFADWYARQYPDAMASGMNPLAHYLLLGAAEGRNPSPYFDTRWYVKNYPQAASRNPLAHYLEKWRAEKTSPNPYFDSPWYYQRYLDVAPSGMEPLMHYLLVGASQSRNPHPCFTVHWYKGQYPRAKRCDNPLLHFLLFGDAEQLHPNPLFNRTWYSQQYKLDQDVDPVLHFLEHGWENNPGPYFDTTWYQHTYPDLAPGLNPLAHYFTYGRGDGHSPNPRHLARHLDDQRQEHP